MLMHLASIASTFSQGLLQSSLPAALHRQDLAFTPLVEVQAKVSAI